MTWEKMVEMKPLKIGRQGPGYRVSFKTKYSNYDRISIAYAEKRKRTSPELGYEVVL